MAIVRLPSCHKLPAFLYFILAGFPGEKVSMMRMLFQNLSQSRGLAQEVVANLWTEFGTCGYWLLANVKEPQTLTNSWWLQLSKGKNLAFGRTGDYESRSPTD
jgi:hypothetical protein